MINIYSYVMKGQSSPIFLPFWSQDIAVDRYHRNQPQRINRENVAALGTSLPSATQVDLSATAAQMLQERANIGINTAVLKSSLDTDRQVLDILA